MRISRNVCALGCALALALMAAADSTPRGIVRVEGRTLCDADGPFLGLGATYMQALRHCKFDRDRLDKELTFLADCGFNYVRVLSMVDWPGLEIAPVDHENREGRFVAAWPDYDERLAELVEIVHSHGMRTQVTIFADAQSIMPEAEARHRHVRRVMRAMRGREEKVILCEIANEAWQNGFPGDGGIEELRQWGRAVAESSPVLLALSSPPDIGNRAEALARLYAGGPATIATVHFSRDRRTEMGAWLPVVDCWDSRRDGIPPISSNEPIGPGASVASEDEPETILAAAAFCYLAGLPMYVFHSGAGVRAEQSFETMPWLRRFESLLVLLPHDLPNWERFDSSSSADAPVTPQDDALPRYNCGARTGDRFILLPLALPETGRTFWANSGVTLSIYPLPGLEPVQRLTAAKNEVFTVKTSSKACIIEGVIRR